MKIFSAEQIKQWDIFFINDEPINSLALMERAARACYQWLQFKFIHQQNYMVVCGTGNNGADGLAIARMLVQAGKLVSIFICKGGNHSQEFTINLQRLRLLLKHDQFFEGDLPPIDRSNIVIDAIFGTGLNKALSVEASALVSQINESKNIIVSIDMPSGLFADATSVNNIAVKAHYTLTFQTYKLALMMTENSQYLGETIVLNINLSQQFVEVTSTPFSVIDKKVVKEIYQPRSRFSHKYNFGHSLIIAGSQAMMGAAILCAKACLRSGAGVVTVKTTNDTAGIIQAAFPEAITNSDDDWRLIALKKTCIAIGPGLADTTANEKLLVEILTEFEAAIVIDATALKLLAGQLPILEQRRHKSVILTPHTGEFDRLFGSTNNDFERMDLCRKMAVALNCFIILKGHHTMVAFPDDTLCFNITGNAGMATAGSGDVLAGILTALVCQGYSAKKACLLGVHLHGLAGDIAAEENGMEAMIASDIINALGNAFLKIENYSD